MSSIILIFKENYVNRYFLVNSREDRAKACHKILLEREASGYWYPSLKSVEEDLKSQEKNLMSQFSRSAQTLISLTDEEVEALPDPLKNNAMSVRSTFAFKKKRVLTYINKEKWFATSMQTVKEAGADGWKIKDQDGRYTCIDLIDHRSNGEYEGYEFGRLESLELGKG